ncbi:glycosyltransferase family 2 protein [Microbacterium kyungheense]|uniref:Glycosyl transferase family 2 n=1 Tax=Microbacterium kyungheense TaxID=1263636 RepID=A0A543FM17_9MICO|nr:glycosyltransferase family 2 protein [Microbacterium kyungheense]TQM34885.1 glycosyl transferase family 2 [Microbacterium kyungheense]
MPLAPRVAVVIPCRNDAEYLQACLAALAAQTHPADLVVVVDNASTDASAEVARRFGAVVVAEPAIGIWPAAARGYDEALEGADIIARLDADSRPHSDWVARLVRAFVSDPSLGVLTGGAEFYGGSPLQNYLGERWYIGGGHYWIRKWLGIPLVFGSNFAMRTRVWERVRDQVDRGNARIHDDLDLTIRLRSSDGVRYDPQLRMPVSARPVQSVGGLSRRVFKVASTFAASWPEGAAWRRAGLEGEQRRRADAGGEWIADGDDWTPEYGG